MQGPGSKGLGRFRLRAHPGARALRNRKHLHIRQIVQIDMGPLCSGCTLFTGAAESQALRGGSHFAVEGYSEAIACEEKVLRERPKVSPSLRIFAARHSQPQAHEPSARRDRAKCSVCRRAARSSGTSTVDVSLCSCERPSGRRPLRAKRDCPRDDRIRKLDRRDESPLTPALGHGIQAEYEYSNNHAPIVHARTNRG
jgi:hypothetical protein